MSRRSRRHTGSAAIGRDSAENGPASDALRRLGPLEYLLLGLIALGIAITVAMALLNP